MNKLHMAMALGFVMGLRHATDSDHIVAMSTLISRTKQRGISWLLGAFWGMGHTVTILAVGAAIIVLKVSFPKGLASALEFTVGVMLVVLGIMNLLGLRMGSWGIKEHSHAHDHDEEHHHHLWPAGEGEPHSHPHHHPTELENLFRSVGRFQLLRSLSVGMVHGLAGSTAIALLVLAAIPGSGAGMAYLAVFGVGSMVSMAVLSAFMEFVMRRVTAWAKIETWFIPATGMMSLAFGLYIMYENSVVPGFNLLNF